MKNLKLAIKILLFFSALTPLVITSFSPFPFVFGKMIFYRSLMEIALILFLIYLVLGKFDFKNLLNFGWLKNPLFISLILFIFSAVFSTLLADNVFRGIFGDVERGEGLLSLLAYVVFLFISLCLFKKDDWIRFFKISLSVGVIMFFYAFLSYFGIKNFPLAFGVTTQPGSFIGNPAFLASYTILLLGFAAIIFHNSIKKSFWRYAVVVFSFLALATIFITGVRGAVLGLGAGIIALFVYWAVKPRPVPAGDKSWLNLRTLALIALGIIIVFSGIFWLTRENKFWRAIPGLNRLSVVSFEIPSVKTRLLSIGISWQAFKERPLFGWGMENYIIAYNKYYDPTYAFYAEDWFDRAHNKILDVLVMQGILGLLIYLGLFVSIFYLLFKPKLQSVRPFLMAVIISYFIQNLFAFDQINSYIPFFALLGFIISESAVGGGNNAASVDAPANLKRILLTSLSFIIIGITGYSIYTYNYTPLRQAWIYRNALATRTGDKILAASDNFLYPYNFMQSNLRALFVDLLYNNKLITNKQYEPLVNKALSALEEVANKEPYEPRYFVRLVESYNERAKTQPELFKKSETLIRKAIELSPKRQSLSYLLAFVLGCEKRYDEAIALAREILALDPRVAKSHYHLSIALALAADDPDNKESKETYQLEAEKELDIARESGKITNFILFSESDIKNMILLYQTWRNYGAVVEMIEVAETLSPKNKDYYYDAITVYRVLRNKDGIIRNAEKLKALDPELANDMDAIIDLAEKENWEILDTL